MYSYTPQWAAFTWEGLQDWVKQQEGEEGQGGGGGEEQEELGSSLTLEEGESLVPLGPPRKTVTDIKQTWHQEGEGRTIAAVPTPAATETTETAATPTSAASPSAAAPDNSDAGVEVGATRPRWTMEDFQRQSRKFNIDLVPRLLYSRGDMVELLISSNISRSAAICTA